MSRVRSLGRGFAAPNNLITGQAAFVGVIYQFEVMTIAMRIVSPLVLFLRKRSNFHMRTPRGDIHGGLPGGDSAVGRRVRARCAPPRATRRSRLVAGICGRCRGAARRAPVARHVQRGGGKFACTFEQADVGNSRCGQRRGDRADTRDRCQAGRGPVGYLNRNGRDIAAAKAGSDRANASMCCAAATAAV